MAKLTGTNPDQVPTNADLGTMAYQDKDKIKVGTIESTTESGAVLLKTGDDQYSSVLVGKRPFGDNFANIEFDAGQNNGVIKMEAEGSGQLKFVTASSPVMTMLSNGNVGIGTGTPNYLLDIETNGGGEGVSTRIYNTGTTVSDSAFLYLRTGSSTAANGIVFGDGANPIAGSINYFHNGDSLQVVVNAAERMRIRSNGELDIASGLLELDGNDIGGTQVTIADDAVASITPPRTGGFMFVTTSGNSDFPNVECSGAMLYYDVGVSLRLDKGSPFSGSHASHIDVTTSDVTGTTGTDNNITIAAQTDVLKIENRNGGSRTLQVTFL